MAQELQRRRAHDALERRRGGGLGVDAGRAHDAVVFLDEQQAAHQLERGLAVRIEAVDAEDALHLGHGGLERRIELPLGDDLLERAIFGGENLLDHVADPRCWLGWLRRRMSGDAKGGLSPVRAGVPSPQMKDA